MTLPCPFRAGGMQITPPEHDHWRGPSEHEAPKWARFKEPPGGALFCSYCGGMKPECVLDLLAAGWSDAIADSRRKGYLHPPGWREWFERSVLGHAPVGSGDVGAARLTPPDELANAPFIKFYTAHFSTEQMFALDALRGKPREARP